MVYFISHSQPVKTLGKVVETRRTDFPIAVLFLSINARHHHSLLLGRERLQLVLVFPSMGPKAGGKLWWRIKSSREEI